MSVYSGQGPDPMDNLPNTECAEAFKERMKGRVYNWQEFKTAWNWYQLGWEEAHKELTEGK